MNFKIVVLMTLLISTVGCRRSGDPNSYPRIEDQEQLSPAFYYTEIDGRMYIDVERSRCNSRIYRISKEYVGQVGDSVLLDIRECDRIIGYSADVEYPAFATWLESMRQWLLAWL